MTYQIFPIIYDSCSFIHISIVHYLSLKSFQIQLSVLKEGLLALAGVDQWMELRSKNQRVPSSIPSWGTWQRCRLGPQ